MKLNVKNEPLMTLGDRKRSFTAGISYYTLIMNTNIYFGITCTDDRLPIASGAK